MRTDIDTDNVQVRVHLNVKLLNIIGMTQTGLKMDLDWSLTI